MAGGPGEHIGQAHVGVSADNSELHGDIRETEAYLRDAFGRMDKLRARPEVEADIRQANRDLAAVKVALSEIDGEIAEAKVDVDTSDLKRKRAELLAFKRGIERDKIVLNLEMGQVVAGEKTMRSFERSVSDADAVARRLTATTRKQGVEVAKLRQRYADLQRQIAGHAGNKRLANQNDILALERLQVELRATSDRLRELGSTADDINVKGDRHNDMLRRWGSSLSNIRIHMGVASLTLRQFGTVLLTLGPIIEGLLGATSALVGSLGSALLGAVGVGAAGILALGINIVGLTQAVQPAWAEVQNLQSAFEAADEAAIKFGAGSDEAKTAQQNLNKTLQNSSPIAVQYARSVNALGNTWQKLTGPTRQDFFGIMATGAKALQSQLPMLARNLNQTMDAARTGVEGWADMLTSPKVSGAIDNLLGNFTDALPSVMRGLGSLGVALINTFSNISDHFQSLGQGFANWAASIRRYTSGAGFGRTVEGWIDSMRQWGALLQSTGSLMATFFGAGKKAGDGLLKTLTNTFDRWNEGMQTMEGQNSLADFFERSIAMTEQFASALGPLLGLLFNMAQVTAPLVQGALQLAEAISSLMNAFLTLPGAVGIIQLLGGAMAAAFVVGRVTALAGAIRGLAMSFGLLRGAAAGGAVAAGIATAMGGAATATKATTVATTGLGARLGMLLGRINPVTGALLTLGAVGYAAFKHNQEVTQEWADTQDRLNTSLSDGMEEVARSEYVDLAEGMDAAAKASEKLYRAVDVARARLDSLNAAERTYQDTVKQSGENSGAAAIALYRLNNQREKALQSLLDVQEAEGTTAQEVGENVQDARDGYRGMVQELRAVNAQLKTQRDLGTPRQGLLYQNLLGLQADRLADVAAAEKVLNQAQNTRAGSMVNYNRVMAGSIPVTQQALAAVGRFSAAFRKVPNAKKLLINTNSSQATADLAKVGNEARKVAGKKATIRILGDSKNAQDAINRLEGLIRRVTQRKWQARIDAIDNSKGAVNSALRGILSVVDPNWKAHLEGDAGGLLGVADAAGSKLKDIISGNPYNAILDAIDGASGVIAGALNLLASFDGRTATSTITTVYNSVGSPGRARAYTGGVMENTPGFAAGADQRMMENAHEAAAQRRAERVARGGKFNKPTYIVGEERRREYVIATNPAYRTQNRAYLGAAANDLGMSVVEGFAGGGMFGPRSRYEDLKHDIRVSEDTYSNMERQYSERLTAGLPPLPTPGQLAAQKTASITGVDKLQTHIRDNIIERLKKQIKAPIPKKLDERLRKSEDPKKNRRYADRLEKRQKAKQKRKDARDMIPQMEDELEDLSNEKYGYKIDLAALLRGEVGGGGGSDGPTLQEQFASFNQQRFDLFKTFGGNFAPLAAGFGQVGATGAVTGSGGALAGATGGGATTTGTNGGVTNTEQTFVNNFAAPPPDAHTWSQELAWEAGAIG